MRWFLEEESGVYLILLEDNSRYLKRHIPDRVKRPRINNIELGSFSPADLTSCLNTRQVILIVI